MKAKIFSFVKVSESSIIASVRIARFVSETLGIPICWDASIREGECLDVLIIINGAYAFSGSEVLESLGEAIQTSKLVVWVQNDYTIIPPKDESGAESPFRKAFRLRAEWGLHPVIYWTTCKDMARPGVAKSGHRIGDYSGYINWNSLTMEPFKAKPMGDRVAANSLIYYGAYRKDRAKYFDRYFKSPLVDTVISCPTKKFEAQYVGLLHLQFETKLVNLYDYISEFGMGLYLEDKKSHVEFHSPANRFYEMLSVGLPIAFQPESQRMMEKAGYDISDWILWNSAEAPQMMERKQEIMDAQYQAWYPQAMNEKDALTTRLKELWSLIS
jgi:hypothetical protein